MAESQFLKRMKKTAAKELDAKTDESVSETVPEALNETAPVYTQMGYDIYSPDGGRHYKVAKLEYNPETGEARVIETKDISRLIALKYDQQKTALGILKR